MDNASAHGNSSDIWRRCRLRGGQVAEQVIQLARLVSHRHPRIDLDEAQFQMNGVQSDKDKRSTEDICPVNRADEPDGDRDHQDQDSSYAVTPMGGANPSFPVILEASEMGVYVLRIGSRHRMPDRILASWSESGDRWPEMEIGTNKYESGRYPDECVPKRADVRYRFDGRFS